MPSLPDASEHASDGYPQLFLITGIMASGKSTVAQRLAERLPRSVHLRAGTPRIGFWLDSSDLTPEQTVEEVLSNRERARVYDG